MAESTISTVTSAAVQETENFLVDYVITKLEEEGITANLVRGGAERDIVVKGIAHIVAFVRAEAEQIRNRLSFQTINELGLTDEAANDAADAIASNFFTERNTGTKSNGVVELHFSRAKDVTIPKNIKFFYSGSKVFFLKPNDNLSLFAKDMVASTDSNGRVASYYTRVALEASLPGSEYDIAPGNFTGAESFSPFFLRAVVVEQFSGGLSKETNAEFQSRGKANLSARMLSSPRAIEAFLRDNFASDIQRVAVFGMGDPEMMRDLMVGIVNTISLHVGGKVDAFTKTPTETVVVEGVVGAEFDDPRLEILTFKDDTADFVAANVAQGDVLVISAGISQAPLQLFVESVTETTITLHTLTPAPEIAEALTYSIGDNYPDFDNRTTGTVGYTSRKISKSGSVFISGPAYIFKEVFIDDGGDGISATKSNDLADPDLFFKVIVHNTAETQSDRALLEIKVRPDSPPNDVDLYDGFPIKIVYVRPSKVGTMQEVVGSTTERLLTGDVLIRGLHPVSVSFTMRYTISSTAASDINIPEAQSYLAAYINSFSADDPLDVSDLVTIFRNKYPEVNRVELPLTLTYTLLAANGDDITYETQSQLVMFDSDYQTVPSPNVSVYDGAVHGISERNITFLAIPDLIILERIV